MTFDKIKVIIAEQLGVEEDAITMETHLMKDLEADSLDAVEIIMVIEDEFDIEVPDEDADIQCRNKETSALPQVSQ